MTFQVANLYPVHVFETAGLAASAIVAFEDVTPDHFQYDVRLVRWNDPSQGYTVQARDVDGFGVGFLRPAA